MVATDRRLWLYSRDGWIISRSKSPYTVPGHVLNGQIFSLHLVGQLTLSLRDEINGSENY